ncbi:MAG: TIGR03905 family TSCPD domain-containing protein [Muribaculaceae bacterium]|nr:TIGR03905 family TSCPD domain-containing protein [Muribaculaceae bacterium]
MTHEYKTQGTCSRCIRFRIDDEGLIHDIDFEGGCPGNTTGVATLAEGRPARAVADLLRGTDCRGRGTSCPDQLAKAIEEVMS